MEFHKGNMRSLVVLVSLVLCANADPSVTRTKEEIDGFKEYLDRTQKDDGLSLEERSAQFPLAKPWENSGKFQGDIVLLDEEKESILRQYAGEDMGRSGVIGATRRWPLNTVVFEFSNEFTVAQRNAITAGMNTIARNTCIRFRQRTASDRAFARITGRSDGCYAHVGHHGASFGAHTYNVALNTPGRGCFHPQVIIHEWLHVVGFQHMHCTHDRDTYVRINWNNIQSGFAFAFQRFTASQVNNFQLPYEYASNMHYGRTAFSRNGQPTMLPIFNDNNQMGQVDRVTARDWTRARRLYNCPGAWSRDQEDLPYENPDFEELPYEDEDTQEVSENEPQEIVEDAPQEIFAE